MGRVSEMNAGGVHGAERHRTEDWRERCKTARHCEASLSPRQAESLAGAGQSLERCQRGDVPSIASISLVTPAKAGVHGGVERVRDTQGGAGGAMDARFRGHDGCNFRMSFLQAIPLVPPTLALPHKGGGNIGWGHPLAPSPSMGEARTPWRSQ